MTKLLLSIHVLAAIVAIGPVTVAASMFPAATRRALADPPDPRDVAVLRNLHRICRVYAALGALVPVFGLVTASSLGVLSDAWLIISIILTATAAAVLAFLVLPGQATVLAALTTRAPTTHPGDLPTPATPVQPGGIPTPAAAVQPDTASSGLPGPAAATGSHSGRVSAVTVGGGGRSAAPDLLSPDGATQARNAIVRLGMLTGVFNVLWAVVVVLMIVRPGSTSGA